MIFGTIANPLDWSSTTFLALIVFCLLGHFVLPRSGTRALMLLREFLFIFPAVLLYFLVRGLVHADSTVAYKHAHQVIRIEKATNLFHELWIQHQVLRNFWLTTLANWVYIWLHWPFLAVTAVWLAIYRRQRYHIYRNAVLLSGSVGMLVFLIYPVSPPRFLHELGFVDTVTLHSRSYRVLQPPVLANLFAAMPSLHFGWNLVMSIAIWRESKHVWARAVAVVIPVAMFLAIVGTANHFILDGLVGGTLVLVSLVVVSVVPERLRKWRARAEEPHRPSWVAPVAGSSNGGNGDAE